MRVTDYEILYDLPAGEYDGRGLDGVRTTTWRAGRSLEVVCHPIVRLPEAAKREAKARRTSTAMEKINARNTQRHIMRLIEANFTAVEAVVITGSYAYPAEDYGMCDLEELKRNYNGRKLPWEMERVRMDVRNWLAALKRRVAKAGGRPRDFKWIVRIEEGKDQPVDLPAKFHFHAVVEGPGLLREVVQAVWEAAGFRHGHADRLDLSDDGAARLSKYFTKQKRGGRWWSHSRNLRAPEPTVSDRKVSRRRLAKIAADVKRDGKEIMEKLYPGYRLVEEPEVRYSDFVAGAYIYARMRKRDEGGAMAPWERARRKE